MQRSEWAGVSSECLCPGSRSPAICQGPIRELPVPISESHSQCPFPEAPVYDFEDMASDVSHWQGEPAEPATRRL